MIQWTLRKIVGTRNQRELKRIWPIVKKINQIEASLQVQPEEALRDKTRRWKEELSRIEDLDVLGKRLEEILPEAFAVVKNAARRLLGQDIVVSDQQMKWDMVHFDVQLIGGVALHRGRIAEMATGEGKTLVATLPVYLNALTGRGVHVVTVNDYLARRDAEWMGALYKFLGLTVGCIQHDQSPTVRREVYAADVTYGTNAEFGFDYLRDNGMATSKAEQVQRGHYFAIVDEVDSVLIDEARTPLIISGPVMHDSHQYDLWKPLVDQLVKKQTALLSEIAAEARQLQEEGKTEEGGRLFYKVKLGIPRHKQLLRAMEDTDMRRAIDKAELSFYQDTQKKELFEFKETLFFTVDEKGHETDLTEKGRSFLDPEDPDAFVLPDLATGLAEIDGQADLSLEEKLKAREEMQRKMDSQAQRMHNIAQLLRAFCLYEKDVNYVIEDNKVIIVDEHTGRKMPGRRWSDGLHQAVEAKEGVHIDKETQTLATITIQNYFRLYEKLAGMTGTAETEAAEFHDIYRLDLLVIPTNKPVRRSDMNDKIYKTQRDKYASVLTLIRERYEKGQPMLIGTASVEASELLSRMLKREKISHHVLNAKNHRSEAEIVANAGQRGAVTVSTNMAGRGTDIKLGPGVVDLGGLFVIGTERHEARRTDRQLRGRCARQGDPGESVFFISFEDKLMLNFGAAERMTKMMERFGMEDGQELEHPWLNKSIESAQKKVEQRNYVGRKRVLDYDNVMNQQREVVYGYRNEVLEADKPRNLIMEALDEAVPPKVEGFMSSEGAGSEPEYTALLSWVNTTFPLRLSLDEAGFRDRSAEGNAQFIIDKVKSLYEDKIKGEHPDSIKELERYVVLNAIDRLWQDHLYAMDGLREGIHLVAMGQKDPLVEYKKEAFGLFEGLMANIKLEVLHNMFRHATSLQAFEQFLARLAGNVPIPGEQAPAGSAPKITMGGTSTGSSASGGVSFIHSTSDGEAGVTSEPAQVAAKAPAVSPVQQALQRKPVATMANVGRNDPCPCGSGKKFKQCHGRNA
ncbi:MAG: preprotein translocase subunit SecA [Verrucomicrobiales bacterium]